MGIHPTALVGADPDTKTNEPTWPVETGKDTEIGPFVSVQRGTTRPTWIGERCRIMHGAYIAHDCIVQDDAVLCANVSLAGHVRVMQGANLGMGATVHQWVTIGAYAMVGMGAVVVDDVPPGVKVAGNPARIIGWNDIGLERGGVEESDMERLRDAFQDVRSGKREMVKQTAGLWL